MIMLDDGYFDTNVDKFGEGKVKSPWINEDFELNSRELLFEK